MDNIKAKHYIEYTKDGITDKFYEGDKVICRTADEEYTGKITCVGEFKENEEAEPVTVICLDTSKSVWSYSSEIIKFDDIEFINLRGNVNGMWKDAYYVDFNENVKFFKVNDVLYEKGIFSIDITRKFLKVLESWGK